MAFLQYSGTSCVLHVLSKMIESGLAITSTSSFSTHGCIPWEPMDLCVSSLSRQSLTRSSSTKGKSSFPYTPHLPHSAVGPYFPLSSFSYWHTEGFLVVLGPLHQIQFLLGLSILCCFPTCPDDVPIFLPSGQTPFPHSVDFLFHLIFFLSSLFIHVGLLPHLPDLLLRDLISGMHWFWAWRRWCMDLWTFRFLRWFLTESSPMMQWTSFTQALSSGLESWEIWENWSLVKTDAKKIVECQLYSCLSSLNLLICLMRMVHFLCFFFSNHRSFFHIWQQVPNPIHTCSDSITKLFPRCDSIRPSTAYAFPSCSSVQPSDVYTVMLVSCLLCLISCTWRSRALVLEEKHPWEAANTLLLQWHRTQFPMGLHSQVP